MITEAKYGEVRLEDFSVLKSAIEIFKKHGLQCGMHGTSLWNSKYKDIDLLVMSGSKSNGVKEFLNALEEIRKQFKGKILQKKGNEDVGLDYDLLVGKTILHISYVVIF